MLDRLLPGEAVDLVAHSMGGNVVMLYGGVRPQRIRRLINLEGFGLPALEAMASGTPAVSVIDFDRAALYASVPMWLRRRAWSN